MSLYYDFVLPRLINLALSGESVTEQRKKCLAGVTGDVLEIGFGTGLNLPWYPTSVQRVVAVDPSAEGAKLARKRIAEARFPVTYLRLAGERLDVPDSSFDSVVSTYTLCTIPDPAAALAQIRRVLKPEGRFFFVEHGRAPDASVECWQNRLNGLTRCVLGGCNTNRDIESLVRNAGFTFDELDKAYVAGQPRVVGFETRAVARATSHHALSPTIGTPLTDAT